MTIQPPYPVSQTEDEKEFYFTQHLNYTAGGTYRYIFEIELGFWDMDNTDSIDIETTIELGNWRDTQIAVYKDDDAVPTNTRSEPIIVQAVHVTSAPNPIGFNAILVERILEGVAGGTFTGFRLTRTLGGIFDTPDYDSEDLSRGTLSIEVTV